MPDSSPASPLLRFADFEVDLRAGELFKLGNRVRIQERPFQVLIVLLERAGEVVTREELSRRVWPADTFVDFDHGLAVAINKVREALGDSADKPRFVETVGRRGYRFLVSVSEPEPARIEGSNQPQMAVPSARPAWSLTGRRIALACGVLSLLLVLCFLTLRGWRWRSPMPSASPSISSIAVLPLKNLSNDPGQEYFAEGMTDELITDLAHLPNLRVISRTSTIHYQDTRKTMPEIARELNVDAIVEGTVLRAGDRVRIRIQLIYAPADQHIWAEAYERDLKDVLTLQANLAQDIASEIRLRLTSQQQARLVTSRSVDPAAHELYLKGRYFWNKRNQEGFNKAVEYFQQAIAKDPNYAVAYAGLADAYVLLGGYGFVPVSEVMPKAKAAAEKALELDSDLAEAHTSLGLIAPYFDWNWDDSKRHFERAIELNPNYATAHHWYGDGYLAPMGKLDDAIAEIRKAQALDPLSPIIISDVGKELFFARRYDEAMFELHRALELDPDLGAARDWLWAALIEKGQYADALLEIEKRKPQLSRPEYLLAVAYTDACMGKRGEAERLLSRTLKLPDQKQHAGNTALVYAALGDKDRAFFWLEKTYAVKSSYLTSLKIDPAWDPLRSDTRFTDLLRRVGLSQ